MKKIIAISSPGGHWTQLQRITPAFKDHKIVYVSTLIGYAKEVSAFKYYKVKDASSWNKIGLVILFFQVFRIIFIEKPDIVISTGAAPGLFAIILARMFGSKTIWLDSIANYEKISFSGKIARYFTHLHLTQWKHLATSKTHCSGAVL